MSPSISPIRFHEFGVVRGQAFELVGDFIPDKGTGLIVGAKSLGKTFNSIELAVCLATGRPYGGVHEIAVVNGHSRAVRSDVGCTLFVLSEGAEGFQKRLDAARLHLSQAEEAKLQRDWSDDSLPIGVLPAPRMANEEEFKALTRHILAWQQNVLSLRPNARLELIVIDTLAGAFVGLDENRTSDAQEIMSRMKTLSDALGVTVVGITHPAKSGLKTEPKGSVNLGASADFVLSITKGRGRGKHRDIHRTKVRDGQDRTRIARYNLITVSSTHGRDSQIVSFLPIEGDKPENGPSTEAATSYTTLTLEAFELAKFASAPPGEAHTVTYVPRKMVRDFATDLARERYESGTESIQRSVNRELNKHIKAERLTQTKQVSDDGKLSVMLSQCD